MSHASLTGVFLVPPDADPAALPLARRPPRLGRTDRLCALALVAADGALVEAKLDPATIPSERLAVVVGTRFGCHATNEAYYRGILTEGARGASPRLFAYTLPSSPLGEVSIHLGARGPGQTVASGRQSGIEALLRAARLCASGVVNVAVAIAVEVGGGTLSALGLECRDGAVAFVVESGEVANARGASIRASIAGSATAFHAGQPADALAAACARAIVDGTDARSLEVAAGAGTVEALAPTAAWIASGPARGSAALASATDPGGGAAAVLLKVL